MRLSLLLILTLVCARAEDVPAWALKGILAQETRSHYTTTPGTPIEYVDRAVGADGELGPFQMTKDAFDQVKKNGESFTRLKSDTRYAEKLAIRYLEWLYDNAAKGDWHIAVAMYNTGPTGYRRQHSRAIAYLRKVRRLGGG